MSDTHDRQPDFACWCGRPYVYHSERWGDGWAFASMPLSWHPYEAVETARHRAQRENAAADLRDSNASNENAAGRSTAPDGGSTADPDLQLSTGSGGLAAEEAGR